MIREHEWEGVWLGKAGSELGVETTRGCSGLGPQETVRPGRGRWGVMSLLQPIRRKKWEKGREKRDKPVIFLFFTSV